MPGMRRRDFVALLGGAAAAWPLVARSQQTAMPVVGFVYPGAPELSTGVVAAFRKGLGESGFTEGRNVTVEFRFAYNDNATLPELMADLVRRRAAVIVTPGSTPAALAAKAATTSIPVIFQRGNRSDRGRSRHQLQPPRRQCYRHYLPQLGTRGQAARAHA